MNRRLLLGLIAIGLLATGLTFIWTESNHAFGGPCIKAGLVTLAACIAYRDVEKVSIGAIVAVLISIVLIAWRPRLIVIIVPVLIAMWFLRPRRG